MPDANPTTEQTAPTAAPVAGPEAQPVVSQQAAPAPAAKEPEVPAEETEEEGDDEQEEDVLRTEFLNLKDSLEMGMKQFKRMPHLSPESIRNFMIMDLYPILMEIADFANWYVGDLSSAGHGRRERDGGGE